MLKEQEPPSLMSAGGDGVRTQKGLRVVGSGDSRKMERTKEFEV